MNDLNVIDRFTTVFTTYIDSGFGLLTGEVAYLTSVLVAIDIALCGVFWAMDQNTDVIAKLVRKVLYVGAFALMLNNWSWLSGIVFGSFTGLGLSVTSNSLSPQELLRPGFVAGTGFDAARPLLEQASSMLGFTNFFNNFVTVAVLLLAWIVVVLAFFVLAVQLFITIIEFKLTTLAGFVLVPFALWNKTAFLAERVLGTVIGAGIKMMVLAVIIGIGTTLFADFVFALQGQEPSLSQAMSLVLGSIALFGLGIFGPGIAAGLTSGAPQLGGGAVVGTVGGLAAGALGAAGLALGGARLAAGGATSAVRSAAMVKNIVSENLFYPHEVAEILELLSEARTNLQRIAIMEAFLEDRIASHKTDLVVAHAIRLIKEQRGTGRMKDLARALNISQDPFEKRFRALVGSTPKQYASVIRLRDVISRYPSFSTLTEASLDAGYFDQSHFIRDFKLFTGQPPKEFFKSGRYW